MKANSTYYYKAMDKEGTVTKGVLIAADYDGAQAQLRERTLLPLHIQKKQRFFPSYVFKNPFHAFGRPRKWSTQTLIFFTQQLSHLIISGTPLDEALACIASAHDPQPVQSLGEQVVEGNSLHDAMALFPYHFPKPYRAIVAAGEQSGDLGHVLQQLQTYYEDKQQFKQQMVQALLYPAAIALVGCFTTLFLVLRVVPTLLSMVETAQQQLPFATRLLLHISHFLGQYAIPVALLMLLAITIAYMLYKKNKVVERWCHCLLLKSPLLGNYFLKIHLILYLKTLRISLKAGNALLPSLALANSVFTLAPLREAFLEATQKIQEGYSIHQAWKTLPCFSETNLQLLASGEQSGHLIQTLDNIAQWEYAHLQQRLKYFITLFEPFVVLCMGAIILWLVIAILLPIFNLEQINGG